MGEHEGDSSEAVATDRDAAPTRLDAGSEAARSVTVQEADVGTRLDALVARTAGLASAAAARRLISEGRVRVDGRRAAKGTRLQAGQQLSIDPPMASLAQPWVAPCPDVPLEILFADDDLVAVNKPAGLPSHPLIAGDAPTAAGAIAARHPECADAAPEPREGGLVHRLDTGTTGVLIAARSRAAWEQLRDALKGAACEKVYLAEVAGVPPLATVVTAAIGRSGRRSGHVRVGSGRGMMPARTEVRMLERRQASSLVEARLQSGRPHQVRAHLAYLGCPVLGDQDYGDAETRRVDGLVGAQGLRLHALQITFLHPRTGQSVTIQAPRPAWAVRAP